MKCDVSERKKSIFTFQFWLIEKKWKKYKKNCESDIELRGNGFNANFSIYNSFFFGIMQCAKCSHLKSENINDLMNVCRNLCDFTIWVMKIKLLFIIEIVEEKKYKIESLSKKRNNRISKTNISILRIRTFSNTKISIHLHFNFWNQLTNCRIKIS